MKRNRVLVLALFVLCWGLLDGVAFGLATETFGPDSDRDHATVEQPRWPKGIVEVFRDETRVYSRWCNGNENVYFRADRNEINSLLLKFSKVRLQDHEVVINASTGYANSFRGDVIEYNVSLNMKSGFARLHELEEDNAETLEPVLTIYVGDGDEHFKQLKFPDNIIITSDVKGLEVESKAVKPKRNAFYGRIQLNGQDYYTEYQKRYFAVFLTLWEEGVDGGIQIGRVDYKGYLRVALSNEELSMLMRGNSWLTMTAGNHMLKARKDHPGYPVEKLSFEKETAGVEYICLPEAYFGRVLFEDCLPSVPLKENNAARIMVNFPYAGMAMIDKEGCFQVFFTDEQFEKLKIKEPRKNIFIPSYTKTGSASAKYTFPVSSLSRDKKNPGVVIIPKPEERK